MLERTKNNPLHNKILIGIYTLIFATLLFFSISTLSNIKSYLPAYILMVILSVVCFILNNFVTNIFISKSTKKPIKALRKISEYKLSKSNWLLVCIFAVLFTIMIILANFYTSFTKVKGVPSVLVVYFLTPLSLMIAWQEILRFFCKLSHTYTLKEKTNNKSRKIFFTTWACIALVYILSLIFINFPGLINPDASKQILQIFRDSYSNHYSFFVTLIMKFFIDTGQVIFNNYASGVFMYCTFQIIILSLSFALILHTISKLGVNNFMVVIITIWFCIMPYHLLMSNTMFTDTLFTAACIFFTLFCFRIFRNLDNVKLNLVFVCISALCVCLFRPNGFYVVVLSTIFLILLFWKNKSLKFLKIGVTSVVVLSIVILNPVLDVLKVEKTDIINHISVPAQQVAKVLSETKDLSEDQIELINNVANSEQIKKIFNKNNFDSIKFYIRDKGNQTFLAEHINQFLILYIDLGIKHPFEYLLAWSDLTNGYWNPERNTLEQYKVQYLELTIKLNRFTIECVNNFWLQYYSIANNWLAILQSIGLNFWLLLISLFMVICKKDKALIFTFLPCLFVVLSVIIASPVQGEIRYVYPMFCLMPFFWTLAFTKPQIKKDSNA